MAKINFNRIGIVFGCFLLGLMLLGCETKNEVEDKHAYEKKIDELISKMTLDEKLGQLNLRVGDLFNTGPTVRTRESDRFDEAIRQGQITGIFNIHGAEYTRRLQQIATEESRLGIPLLFGADIIHGFKTVTPIPLGEAASWDLEVIEKSARLAARESSAVGINWTFAPMVDISRDARWGRIAEGAGEDPFLGSMVAEARVRGFQGDSLSAYNSIAACVKHFAAYGAAEAGRDYNTVDMSERLLREVFLPPFKAALDQGAASVMTSFNDLNGIPATGNKFLLDDILRKEWEFNGMVVSDWQSINEMIFHGFVKNREEAGFEAITAGTDMDMEGEIYLKDLKNLIEQNKIEITIIDQAVRRVLELKFKLGLFDDPYRYSDEERERNEIRSVNNLNEALDIAKRSIVLLKNQGNILPLDKDPGKIAVIGPVGNNKAELNGTWSFFGEPQHPVSILEGVKNKVADSANVFFAKGCDFYSDSKDGFQEAVQLAQSSDIIIAAVGESAVMNGEGASRAEIVLPGVQLELIKELKKTGKPVIVLVQSGRPLLLNWLNENVEGLLEIWTLGSQTGHAVAEVLFGDYNPSGKLPVSFPRSVGQIPVYYYHKNTGRPYEGDYSEPPSQRVYRSRYRDIKNSPLFPFGYGLSYTSFNYGEIILEKEVYGKDETMLIDIDVTNTGDRAGEEVVQLYVQDLVGEVTRPVKELKAFQKIEFNPGETKQIRFELDISEALSFYGLNMERKVEPGAFKVFIGSDSQNVKEASFIIE